MIEEYTKNGEKTLKIEYKRVEEEVEQSPIIVGDTVKEMKTYKVAEVNSPESPLKPQIKREGAKRCWCGSGKKFEDCHGKHLRVDKNPKANIEEYEIELNVREINEYDTPDSEKEYEEKKDEEEEHIEEIGTEELDEEKESEEEYEEDEL